ncbi:MAG: hypothetical protein PHQ53_07370 [Candidatus Krumholzibacteria bacterium]|nr:hypothetical protein [Candidatus Krumholzibacteria bacterium]
MRLLLTFSLICLFAMPALADKEVYPDVASPTRDACELESVMFNWDFSEANHGFTPVVCDATGGAPSWAWGATDIAGAPAAVWGTVLVGNYPNNAGEGLLSPVFAVTPDSYLMEIYHYVHVENNFDGGNVKVDDQVILPINGYTHPIISESTSYYAFCVDGQPGYSGNGYNGPSQVWLVQCFDLSAFMGQEIQVRFDFGSDSSVAYPGWYLGYVKIGTDDGTVAMENETWTQIKGIFR